MGNSLHDARLTLAMQQLNTDRVSMLLNDSLPIDYMEVAAENNIPLITGQPVELPGKQCSPVSNCRRSISGL
jgi:hypothetical protein